MTPLNLSVLKKMPNRRSNRSKTKKFFCFICQQRLWRTGTQKYNLFYQNAAEIKKHVNITSKKAKFLAAQNTTYLDTKKWIEGFCCSNHGTQWLLISVMGDTYEYRLAKDEDWLQTSKTVDPRISNPSVSEFTLRMSRKLHC